MSTRDAFRWLVTTFSAIAIIAAPAAVRSSSGESASRSYPIVKADDSDSLEAPDPDAGDVPDEWNTPGAEPGDQADGYASADVGDIYAPGWYGPGWWYGPYGWFYEPVWWWAPAFWFEFGFFDGHRHFHHFRDFDRDDHFRGRARFEHRSGFRGGFNGSFRSGTGSDGFRGSFRNGTPRSYGGSFQRGLGGGFRGGMGGGGFRGGMGGGFGGRR